MSRLPLRHGFGRRNRLGNVAQPQQYLGRRYDSRQECAHAMKLDALKAAIHERDRVHTWKPQVTVPLDVNGVHICNYRVDFHVTYADGHEEWHEVKGFETELWIIKARLFKACYPDRVYKVLKR